jgi:hypothetical protein
VHLKLPEDVPLADAQREADEVEGAIKREVPTVELVRAHLEPLGEPLPAAPLSKTESTELENYIAKSTRSAVSKSAISSCWTPIEESWYS